MVQLFYVSYALWSVAIIIVIRMFPLTFIHELFRTAFDILHFPLPSIRIVAMLTDNLIKAFHTQAISNYTSLFLNIITFWHII